MLIQCPVHLTYASIESFAFFSRGKKHMLQMLLANWHSILRTWHVPFIFDLFTFSSSTSMVISFCFVLFSMPFFSTAYQVDRWSVLNGSAVFFHFIHFASIIRNAIVSKVASEYSHKWNCLKRGTNWLKMIQYYRGDCLIVCRLMRFAAVNLGT